MTTTVRPPRTPSSSSQSIHLRMPPKTLKQADLPPCPKSPKIVKLKIPFSVSPLSLTQSVQFTISPRNLKNSQLPPHTFSQISLKKVKLSLDEVSPNLKSVKIMVFSKSGFYKSPKQVRIFNKKRKQTLDGDEDEYDDIKYELLEDEDAEIPIRRTRSENPDLYGPLSAPTRARRPKVYPSLTPWLDDWNVAGLNDSHPKEGFKWDNSDVPDFDLGEPLDETNFWEQPWIAANEDKKRNRDGREKNRKKQLRYGGLKVAGRKRTFKKRFGVRVKRENGKFVKLESY